MKRNKEHLEEKKKEAKETPKVFSETKHPDQMALMNKMSKMMSKF
jgi:hypothetical protein